MEMSQLYDEDLLENKFFQQFCDMCLSLFQSAVQNEWLICVPKVGTFESHVLTEQDCMSHVLIEVSPSLYKTASDKHVSISEKVILLGDGFEQQTKVQMLFSETFYTDKQKKYQVWCVDKPLSFECTVPAPSVQAQSAEFRILNVDDSVELLFTGQGCSLKRTLDKMIHTHKSALGVSDTASCNIRDLIDKMHMLFTKCLQASLKDNHLKRRMNLNRHISDNVRISVETYTTHRLYTDLFKYICTAVAGDDAKLNKINRNLSQISLKDFGIVSEFSSNLPRARRELLTLVSFTTPLAKMASIKRVISALMQSPKKSQETEPLTADDLIPMLVFLIVRSSIPTWMANFEYMTQFHFSKSSLDEYSFYLSTLEAALFYIKSGELTKLLNSPKTSRELDLSVVTAGSSSRRTQELPQIDILFEAIKSGDVTAVRSLLEYSEDGLSASIVVKCHPLCSCDKCERERDEEGANPRSQVTVFSRDDRGYTAMHQAAHFGCAETIEYLKTCGAVVNATDYHSSTPLHISCQRGHQSAVMMLIDCGANVNACDNDGNRPLHMATLNGHEDCIKALLYQSKSDALDINAANENGDTALHQAAKWSYESITGLLLEHGAWPEARNRRNATPMMLVSHGAIANLLTEAIECEQENANDGFIELSASMTPPQSAYVLSDVTQENSLKTASIAFAPHVKVSKKVKKFLRAVSDCDINMIKHLMGWSEPDYNSSENSDDIGELCHPLCQCKKCAPTQRIQASLVDINAGDEQGRTALHIAAERSNREILTMLLQKHAEVNCKTNLVQFTPLHIACQQLSPDQQMVELLITHGAKVNCKDCNGRTPLHFSSQTGSTAITRLLLESRANVNVTNIRGNTPLHEACKVNNVDIVPILIEHRADPTLANKNGLTAIQVTSDSKIIRLVTEAMERWKDNLRAAELACAVTSVTPALRSSPQHRPSNLQSISVRKDMYAALETDDASKVNALLASINKFNRRSLRRTVTRDLSAPLLNINAITVAQEREANQLHESSTLATKAKPVNNVDVIESENDSAKLSECNGCSESTENRLKVIQKAATGGVAIAQPLKTYVHDEHPECDLQQKFENLHYREFENSGTESAEEH